MFVTRYVENGNHRRGGFHPYSASLHRRRKPIYFEKARSTRTQRNKHPIHARYERLLDGGTKPTLAKLRLARMIAAAGLRMWKNEEEYDPGRAGWPAKTRKG